MISPTFIGQKEFFFQGTYFSEGIRKDLAQGALSIWVKTLACKQVIQILLQKSEREYLVSCLRFRLKVSIFHINEKIFYLNYVEVALVFIKGKSEKKWNFSGSHNI